MGHFATGLLSSPMRTWISSVSAVDTRFATCAKTVLIVFVYASSAWRDFVLASDSVSLVLALWVGRTWKGPHRSTPVCVKAADGLTLGRGTHLLFESTRPCSHADYAFLENCLCNFSKPSHPVVALKFCQYEFQPSMIIRFV